MIFGPVLADVADEVADEAACDGAVHARERGVDAGEATLAGSGRLPARLDMVSVPHRRTVLAALSTLVAATSLAIGSASSGLQLAHLASLAASYVMISATAVISIVYLRSSPRRSSLDRIGGATARAVVLALVIALVSGAAWSYSFSDDLWSWEPRLTSTMIILLAVLGYPAVRRLDASKPQRAARCAVVAIAAAGQIPFLWLSLLIWDRTPSEGAALIPSVWTFENDSDPIRLVVLLTAALVLLALFIGRQTERALASDGDALDALDQAIIERHSETR